jgi:hypothetical protein
MLSVCLVGLGCKTVNSRTVCGTPVVPDFIASGQWPDCISNVISANRSGILPNMVKFEIHNGSVVSIGLAYPTSVGFEEAESALKSALGNANRHELQREFVVYRTRRSDLSWRIVRSSENGNVEIWTNKTF